MLQACISTTHAKPKYEKPRLPITLPPFYYFTIQSVKKLVMIKCMRIKQNYNN